MGRFTVVCVFILALSACAGKESTAIQPLQKKDKQLSCREIQLEINEAEFYQRSAKNNKNPGVETFLMPLGYISTYMSANDAAKSADARINYLNRIYDILNCDAQNAAPRVVQQQPLYAPNQPQLAPPTASPQPANPSGQYW